MSLKWINQSSHSKDFRKIDFLLDWKYSRNYFWLEFLLVEKMQELGLISLFCNLGGERWLDCLTTVYWKKDFQFAPTNCQPSFEFGLFLLVCLDFLKSYTYFFLNSYTSTNMCLYYIQCYLPKRWFHCFLMLCWKKTNVCSSISSSHVGNKNLDTKLLVLFLCEYT